MARHSILQTFYASDIWKDFRLTLINERGMRCEHCGERVLKASDITAHHKIELTPDNVHDVMIALNPENILLVHHTCHNEIHGRFIAKRAKEVYIVYGAPLAGKKSFVRDRMMRGDLVVDIDSLFEAVSFQPSHDKPDNLLSNVMALQNTLLDNIKTRSGKWGTAWIIGGYPERFRRDRLANELGAELVFIHANKDECKSRLLQDEYMRFLPEWQGYIDKWFEQYQE